LILATNNNHIDVVRLLVNNGANTTICTSSGGNTAFTIAIWNGFLECAKLLYKDDIINAKNPDGKYPLMQACSQGHHECVKWLRKNGADVNAINDDGYSAIFYASHHGKLDCVEALIKGKGKADINLKNKFGNTCLYKAIENGHFKVIQALVNGGADVNSKNNHGITPIMQSAWSGKLDSLKYLIERKAQLNDQDNKGTTTTATTTAISITTYTNANTNTTDTGETALMKSAFKNTLVCLKVLLSSGARHDIRDKAGMLAIHHSCISGAKDTLKALIDRSIITIDEKDRDGNTPLHIASINAHSKTCAILLQSRCNINAQNNRKDTALILASKLGRSEVVKVLLDAGADPTKVNLEGHNALTHSRKDKVRDVLLEKMSSFVSSDENDGTNPVDGMANTIDTMASTSDMVNTNTLMMDTTDMADTTMMTDTIDSFDKTRDDNMHDNDDNKEEEKILG